jgi:hypothetical protein
MGEDLNKLVKTVGEDEKERALMRAVLREFTVNCKSKCATKFANLLASFGDNQSLLIVKSARAIADRLLCRDYTGDEPQITNFIIQHLNVIKVDYIRSKLACERKLAVLSKSAVTTYNDLLRNYSKSPVIAAAIAAINAGVPDHLVAETFGLTKAMLKYVKRKASVIEVSL